MDPITSTQNLKLRELRKLQDKKHRKRVRLFAAGIALYRCATHRIGASRG